MKKFGKIGCMLVLIFSFGFISCNFSQKQTPDWLRGELVDNFGNYKFIITSTTVSIEIPGVVLHLKDGVNSTTFIYESDTSFIVRFGDPKQVQIDYKFYYKGFGTDDPTKPLVWWSSLGDPTRLYWVKKY